MRRRNFLGMFGAAVASGPKAIADVGLQGLNIRGVVAPLGLGGYEDRIGQSPSMDNVSWAKSSLERLRAMTPWARDLKRRSFHMEAMDPNTASLRSVSLSQKIRISHRRQYEASCRMHDSYLEGVIAGLLE